MTHHSVTILGLIKTYRITTALQSDLRKFFHKLFSNEKIDKMVHIEMNVVWLQFVVALISFCNARPRDISPDLPNNIDQQMSNLIITMAGRLNMLEAQVEDLKKKQTELEKNQCNGGPYSHEVARISGPPPLDCAEIKKRNQSAETGVYYIKPRGAMDPFKAFCDMDSDEHGWTVIQRRTDGSEDFNRNWREYSRGFGNLSSEFWLGLESMHDLLQQYPYKLRVDLTTWDGSKLYAEYAGFMLGNKKGNYRLRLDDFIGGNATNALSYHAGSPFTTVDKDNDQSSVNCAVVHHGGWWFRSCDRSNLNGLYRTNPHYNGLWDDGIEWKQEDGPPFYSYRTTQMKVRPME